MPPSTVDLYAMIRRDLAQGMTIRAVMRKHSVSHRTIKQAQACAWPQRRKKLPPRATRLDPYKPVIDEILRSDLDAPRKQRHTAQRIFQRLLGEHGATDLTYGIVRRHVAQRRGDIRREAGRAPAAEVFISQTHRPGAEAEVDFGDVTVRLAGEQVTLCLFSFRLSYSGKAVHRVFASGGQEAFFEGHVHALSVLGGVPFGKVRYDNLKAAVAQVLGLSRARVETQRWTAFRSHFGIESFYCRPGIHGAHEKGGVEGDVGWFRRNHFVPVPEVASLAELNAMVERWDIADGARRIGTRARTVDEYFAAEQPHLKPLPDEPFETGLVLTQRVDRHGRISVRTNRYSVPARLIHRQVRILLHASELVVYDGRSEVARHERLMAKGGSRLNLDHYLEVLLHKPGALPGSTALEQARSAGKFTPIHDAWWEAVRKAHGDTAGTRALIEVLLLARHMAHEHIVAGIAAALRSGALTADAVALEARKAAETDTTGALPPETSHEQGESSPVASLTRKRLARQAHLPADARPMPSLEGYDALLRRSTGDNPRSRDD